MLRITLVMLLCTAIASLSKADEPDATDALKKNIEAEIEAATLAYDAAMKTARDNVAKLLERKVSFATSRGDIQAADAAKLELENFLVKDQKPTLVSARIFDKVRSREIQRLIRVHEDGVRRYTKAGMAGDARNLQDIVEALTLRNLESSSNGILDRQLLLNPGCEQAPTKNGFVAWKIVAGNWRRSVDNPDPKSGQGSFASQGAQKCVLVQGVDLEELASYIDSSSIAFKFTGELFRGAAWENGQLAIDFLGERGQLLESFHSPIPKLKNWQSMSVEGPVPVGSRVVRVQLSSWFDSKRSKRANARINARVWYDDLDLRLTLKD